MEYFSISSLFLDLSSFILASMLLPDDLQLNRSTVA